MTFTTTIKTPLTVTTTDPNAITTIKDNQNTPIDNTTFIPNFTVVDGALNLHTISDNSYSNIDESNEVSLKDIDQSDYKQIVEILQKDGLQIKHLKNQRYELCAIAISQNPGAYVFIREPTEELGIMAVQLDYHMLNAIKNQTRTIIETAIEIDPQCYIYIDRDKFLDLYNYAKLKTL